MPLGNWPALARPDDLVPAIERMALALGGLLGDQLAARRERRGPGRRSAGRQSVRRRGATAALRFVSLSAALRASRPLTKPCSHCFCWSSNSVMRFLRQRARRHAMPGVEEFQHGRAAAGVLGVGRELEPAARPRQGDLQDLADGGRRPVGHHHHAIRQQHRLVDVVGDHHHRVAEPRMDLHDAVLQMGAGQRVERAERLVHQQHLGLHGERAGDADALLHAAGDLVRALVLGLRHLHQLEIVHHPVVALGLGLATSRTPCRRRWRRCRRR